MRGWLTTLVSDEMGMSVWWRRRFVQVMAGGAFDGSVRSSRPWTCVDFARLRRAVGKAVLTLVFRDRRAAALLPANVQRHAVSVAEAGQDAADLADDGFHSSLSPS